MGSVWTWTAIDAGTKLVPWFHVGTRDAGCASEFMQELAPRLRGRVQLTTDGHKAYLEAVHNGFGREIDYAMLVKLYGAEPSDEARYSPPKCIGTRTEVKCGDPDPEHISTSYAERQNLNMRMGMRRFHAGDVLRLLQLRAPASDAQDDTRRRGRRCRSR
ncbi:MAG: DDE-type integrase/transposase/recombinase, partial [Deltaproteobacteria bacterium]